MPSQSRAEAESVVAEALKRRARTQPSRAKKLAAAYLQAAQDRAVAVTTALELPPTAMKSAQLALLLVVLDYFEDVPTRDELAAMLRITPTSARTLLGEVLATSDRASERLLASVFARAKKGNATGPGGDIPNGVEWSFASATDLQLARDRLEFMNINYRTRKTADGQYVLLVDPAFTPATSQ